MSESQIAAIDEFAGSDLFDEREKAVLRFAEQLTRQAKVDQQTVKELEGFLDQRQLVILSAVVGLANWTNRFNEAFGIELP